MVSVDQLNTNQVSMDWYKANELKKKEGKKERKQEKYNCNSKLHA